MVEIERISGNQFVDPWTGDDWSLWLRTSHHRHGMVARRNGVTIGFVVYHRYDDHIAVEKIKSLGSGFSELIRNLVFRLAGKCARFEILVEEDDQPMIDALREYGLRAIELVPGEAVDHYVMAYGNQDQTQFRYQQRECWAPANRISKFFQSDL